MKTNLHESIIEAFCILGIASEEGDPDLCELLAYELATLTAIFNHRRDAVKQRLSGLINDAVRNERHIDRLYADLHTELKW